MKIGKNISQQLKSTVIKEVRPKRVMSNDLVVKIIPIIDIIHTFINIYKIVFYIGGKKYKVMEFYMGSRLREIKR